MTNIYSIAQHVTNIASLVVETETSAADCADVCGVNTSDGMLILTDP